MARPPPGRGRIVVRLRARGRRGAHAAAAGVARCGGCPSSSAGASKLEALLTLRAAAAVYGVVKSNGSRARPGQRPRICPSNSSARHRAEPPGRRGNRRASPASTRGTLPIHRLVLGTCRPTANAASSRSRAARRPVANRSPQSPDDGFESSAVRQRFCHGRTSIPSPYRGHCATARAAFRSRDRGGQLRDGSESRRSVVADRMAWTIPCRGGGHRREGWLRCVS